MMQNRIDEIFWGQTFKNAPYFNLRDSEFWVLGPGSLLRSWYWYPDPGTKILVPGSWYQDLGTKILVPSSLGEPVLHDGGNALSVYPN